MSLSDQSIVNEALHSLSANSTALNRDFKIDNSVYKYLAVLLHFDSCGTPHAVSHTLFLNMCCCLFLDALRMISHMGSESKAHSDQMDLSPQSQQKVPIWLS